MCRGLIHPLPAHKSSHTEDGHSSRLSALFYPLTPVLGAYGGLAQMAERLRLGVVAIAPEVNLDVTINVARNIPGGCLAQTAPKDAALPKCFSLMLSDKNQLQQVFISPI